MTVALVGALLASTTSCGSSGGTTAGSPSGGTTPATDTASPTSSTGATNEAGLFNEQCKDATRPTLPDLTPITGQAGNRDVKTPLGQASLPNSPKAALGMYTTDVDMLIWLGYPLAASQPVRDQYPSFPCFFPYAQLKNTKTFPNYPNFNFESIAAAEPDFILNGLGYEDKVVKRLPEIAPTYSVDAFDGKSWRVHFEQTARDMGREDRYQLWKKTYDTRLAEVKAKLGDTSKMVVAPVGYRNGKFSSSCYSGVECQVFDDLGLKVLPLAKQNGGKGADLSDEQLGQLNGVTDAFTPAALGEAGKKGTAEFKAALAKNPLGKTLPFLKNDTIHTYEMEMTFGSPSGQLAFLDVVEKSLGK